MIQAHEAARLYAELEDVAPSLQKPARRPLRCHENVLRMFRKLGEGRCLLDIGAGEGEFLAAASSYGYECVGTDVSASLAKLAAARSGRPVHIGQIVDLDLPPGSFDWANLDQVLSYIANPREAMRKIATLLRPGGMCRVREYNPESLSARLKGKNYWMYGPTIVNVWTPQAIAAVATSAGLQLKRVYAGTEASLTAWLATVNTKPAWRRLYEPMLFLLRRVRVLGVSLAADTVYYLQKPTDGVAAAVSTSTDE
jgi:SAM-dependent methyltransferase